MYSLKSLFKKQLTLDCVRIEIVRLHGGLKSQFRIKGSLVLKIQSWSHFVVFLTGSVANVVKGLSYLENERNLNSVISNSQY